MSFKKQLSDSMDVIVDRSQRKLAPLQTQADPEGRTKHDQDKAKTLKPFGKIGSEVGIQACWAGTLARRRPLSEDGGFIQTPVVFLGSVRHLKSRT